MKQIKKLKFSPEYKLIEIEKDILEYVKTGNLLKPNDKSIIDKINELVDIVNKSLTPFTYKYSEPGIALLNAETTTIQDSLSVEELQSELDRYKKAYALIKITLQSIPNGDVRWGHIIADAEYIINNKPLDS